MSCIGMVIDNNRLRTMKNLKEKMLSLSRPRNQLL
jgi:hypothetical protein